jgi:hypothetical protein
MDADIPLTHSIAKRAQATSKHSLSYDELRRLAQSRLAKDARGTPRRFSTSTGA